MKFLPPFTILFWLVLILGSIFYPDFFLKEYVQYPHVIVLSIFLPVSFWLKVKENKKVFSLIYVAIFLMNIVFLLVGVEQNFSKQKNIDGTTRKGIVPEIVELLSEGEQSDRSRFAAQYIYQKHAVVVPYKVSGNNFTLYMPSQEDKSSYKANFAQRTHLDVSMMNATGQMLSAFFLLMLHAGIFIMVIVFLVVYEHDSSSVTDPRT
ncbi:MAG: hypothetical protein WBB19_13760 [Desulforhopalus sp.]